MIRGTEDTRYAYVNGIIRALEARLLTRGHFDRLIAADHASFNTILSDTPYVRQDDLLNSLDAEEESVRSFFNRFCITEEVKSFIDWPEQLHNIKVKLKEGGEDLLYKQDANIVESWPEVLDEVARFAVDKDPFVLSTNLDRILCKYVYQTAVFVPFFQYYYEMYFELENIRSFFRARQFENRREIFKQVYLPWGRLKLEFFVDNLDVAQEQLGRNFFNTPYVSLIEKGGAYFEENNSFLRLERLYEEYRFGYLLKARRMTFGVEPLFTYYKFKTGEITKLRQVYWGKLNEVPVEDLKESIPDVW
ncbi:MAG: V-type ATPase subunit [candidate division WOR-3 bacterium]|nr:MAG: V-type ATPase subunit [candidate division WOR-3 bacterium]